MKSIVWHSADFKHMYGQSLRECRVRSILSFFLPIFLSFIIPFFLALSFSLKISLIPFLIVKHILPWQHSFYCHILHRECSKTHKYSKIDLSGAVTRKYIQLCQHLFMFFFCAHHSYCTRIFLNIFLFKVLILSSQSTIVNVKVCTAFYHSQHDMVTGWPKA